jgi:hypothetical protein
VLKTLIIENTKTTNGPELCAQCVHHRVTVAREKHIAKIGIRILRVSGREKFPK